MIAALFIGLFVLCVAAVGLHATLGIHSAVALLIGWIVTGVYLINPV